MKRRSVLRMAAGVGALGASALSGCLDDASSNTSNTDSRAEWSVSKRGAVDAVVDGTVYARLGQNQRSNLLETVALDAGTGGVEWRHEASASLKNNSGPAVQDGVYLPRCGFEDCTALVALNMDGTERWIQESPVSHRRPVVADDTVCAVTADGRVKAFDATSGERRWEYQTQLSDHPAVISIADDTVFVAGSNILALSRTDGNLRWEYETGGDGAVGRSDAHVSDGIVYTQTSEEIAAVSDGTELWKTTVDGFRWIDGVTSDRVLATTNIDEHQYQLHALDRETGERAWSEGIGGQTEMTVIDDVVYLGGRAISSLDANTGTESWETDVADGSVEILRVIEEDALTTHRAVVKGRLPVTLTVHSSDGEQIWTHSVDDAEMLYAAGKYVFVVKENKIRALKPLDDISGRGYVFAAVA